MFESILKPAIAATFACSIMASPVFANKRDSRFDFDVKIVNGQAHLTGRFGKNWGVEEVKKFMAGDCKSHGRKLISFELGDVHKRKGTAFTAVCTKK